MIRENSSKYIMLVSLCLVTFFIPFIITIQSELLYQPIFFLLPSILIGMLYTFKSKLSIPQFFKIKGVSVNNFSIATIIVLLLPGFLGMITYLTSLVFPAQMYPDDFALLGQSSIFLTLTLAILPGICEEVLFRGCILSMCEDLKWKKWLIVVVNGLLFSTFHFCIEQFFYTFVMGVILSIIMLKTRSIFLVIYMHIVYNFIVSIPEIFVINQDSTLGEFLEGYLAVDNFVYSGICLLLVIGLLYYMQRRK